MSDEDGTGEMAYQDRFDITTYADTPPVRLVRADRYAQFDHEDELWIPESLWHRLRLIGAAYQLHLLPILDGSTDPVFLNAQQLVTFAEELLLVSKLVDDPLVKSQVGAIIQLLRHPGHGASKNSIGIDFP